MNLSLTRQMAILCALFAVILSGQVLGSDSPMTCPEKKGALYPSEDCQAYFECKDGKGELKLCPHGLHYNPQTLQCDLPEKSACAEGQYSLSGPTDLGIPIIPPPDKVVCGPCECKYIFDKCHPQYYQCHLGVVHLKTCRYPLLFNHITYECDYRKNIPGCYDECENFKEPHECTCVTGYTTCCDGERVSVTCPSGTAFNNATYHCDRETFLGACNHPGKCDTCEGLNFGVYGDCRKYLACTAGHHLFLLTCPPGTAFNKKTRRCDAQGLLDCTPPPTRPPGPCGDSCMYDGDYPHPTHCRRWCQCVDTTFYERHCPEGKHFSVASRKCDFPGLAQCPAHKIQWDP